MKLQIPVHERDHAIGPADARVTVVKYGDYECPDCHRIHREIEKTFDKLVSSIRFVYRHFPLINIHPRALRAAEAAEAAATQGKFWEMHRRLYLEPDKLDDRHLRQYAKEVGLDIDRFDQEMAAGTYGEQILSDYYNSINYGISGTPTTFINGELYAVSGLELLASVKNILNEK